MKSLIRKPNRTHRSNKKRISKDFEHFEYMDSSSKAQRRIKKKYAKAARRREKEYLEEEIDYCFNTY